MSTTMMRGDPQDRPRRLHPRGGVRPLHRPDRLLVAGADAFLRRRRRQERRPRAAGRRPALRGDRQGRAGLGQRARLGAADAAAARLADRRGPRHRGRGDVLARRPGQPRRARAPRLRRRRSARALLGRLGRRARDVRRDARRRTPETSAAARPTAPPRWRARSRGARRAPSRRGGAPAARAPAARRTRRGTPPCRRSRSRAAASSSAIRSSRSAEPSKSALRRSPEPGVVR